MPIDRQRDFTNTRQKNAGANNAPEVAFYKLLMTLANMHSTVYSTYIAYGQESLGNFHRDMATRFVNEANRVKNLKLTNAKIIEGEEE